MTIVMKADVIRESRIAHGEVEKQKEFKIVANPFVRQPVTVVCGTEVSVKTFVRSEKEKEYFIQITGENNKVYKEILKNLHNHTEDTETFSFKVE